MPQIGDHVGYFFKDSEPPGFNTEPIDAEVTAVSGDNLNLTLAEPGHNGQTTQTNVPKEGKFTTLHFWRP